MRCGPGKKATEKEASISTKVFQPILLSVFEKSSEVHLDKQANRHTYPEVKYRHGGFHQSRTWDLLVETAFCRAVKTKRLESICAAAGKCGVVEKRLEDEGK